MDAEQLKAAYDKGASDWWVGSKTTRAKLREAGDSHLAGLAEVARQQAEWAARIAETADPIDMALAGQNAGMDLAAAIRAQFEKVGN